MEFSSETEIVSFRTSISEEYYKNIHYINIKVDPDEGRHTTIVVLNPSEIDSVIKTNIKIDIINVPKYGIVVCKCLKPTKRDGNTEIECSFSLKYSYIEDKRHWLSSLWNKSLIDSSLIKDAETLMSKRSAYFLSKVSIECINHYHNTINNFKRKDKWKP